MKKEIWSKAAHVVRYLIPVAILYIIFRLIDWQRFASILTQVNPWLILTGLLFFPLAILLGTLRWNAMLRAYHGERVHYATSFKDYWSGLSMGLFTPASLGWDVFRITVSTRRYGNVIANSATVVVEKAMTLLACAFFVTLLAPFMDIAAENSDLQQIIKMTHIVLVGTLGVLTVFALVARHEATIGLFQRITDNAIQWLGRLSQLKVFLANYRLSLDVILAPVCRPGILLPVLILSFLLQLVGSVAHQIFFISLNYDLPFLVNLFVVPILLFVFSLPISFGSLGVREGVYILLYGAFGVPMETALIVSVFTFFGALLNYLMGGIILTRNPN